MDFTIHDYVAEHHKVFANLNYAEINNAISILRSAIISNKRVCVCGNGGSAATASHLITDLNKMIFHHTGKQFNGICLSDNNGLITAYANDYSYDDIFSEQVKNLMNRGDLLIVISGSGNSKNVVKAISVAHELGVETLGIIGFDGGQVKKHANHRIWIDCNDMQLCEDIQLSIVHMFMKSLCKQAIDV